MKLITTLEVIELTIDLTESEREEIKGTIKTLTEARKEIDTLDAQGTENVRMQLVDLIDGLEQILKEDQDLY